VDERMHNDAARFDGIEQSISSRTDDKTPHRLLKHWCYFGIRPKIAEREIEFADKPHSCFFTAFFQFGEDLEQSLSAPCFQIISGISPPQKSVAQLFPTHAACGFGIVIM